jgi:hypothetical protein
MGHVYADLSLPALALLAIVPAVCLLLRRGFGDRAPAWSARLVQCGAAAAPLAVALVFCMPRESAAEPEPDYQFAPSAPGASIPPATAPSPPAASASEPDDDPFSKLVRESK